MGPHPSPLCGERPREPGAAGACVRDQDKVCGLRVARAGAGSAVGLSGADGTESEALGTVRWRDRGSRQRVFVAIQTTREWARLWHG
jgi:hypothetical protein